MRDIKVLHIESTDVCQAACPLCARETDMLFNKQQQHHLDMNKITQIFSTDQIAQLDKMFMCGNYGDPAAGRHTLAIYQDFRRLNPDIVLGMNTNGALRNAAWWHKLGAIFNQPRDYVVFSIDGLEDTNSIYRINVAWPQLMTNVRAFIASGGSAHWDMLVYQHNQHQVDACEDLARKLGFTWFRAKVSKRKLMNGLALPQGWRQAQVQSTKISCHALNEKSMYIDARGNSSPCCWLGGSQKQSVVDFDAIQSSWNSSLPEPICAATCGTSGLKSSFTNQWQRETQLK